MPGGGKQPQEDQREPGCSPIPGLPVSALFENLESGATVEEFMEWFQPVDEWKVRAVLQHVADSLKAPVPVSSLEDTV